MRPSVVEKDGTRTAVGGASRPLAHKAVEHVHVGRPFWEAQAPRRKAEASPPLDPGSGPLSRPWEPTDNTLVCVLARMTRCGYGATHDGHRSSTIPSGLLTLGLACGVRGKSSPKIQGGPSRCGLGKRRSRFSQHRPLERDGHRVRSRAVVHRRHHGGL